MDKHSKSDQQRLLSFSVKDEINRKRRAIISDALKNGTIKLNKKINFTDSDDEAEKSSKLLCDYDLQTSDNDDSFDLKPRYFGEKGAKLMAMETHFGGDDRFQLNREFLDDVQDDDLEDANSQKISPKSPMIIRFDPKNADHQRYKTITVGTNFESSIKISNNPDLHTRFFHMDTEFAKSLRIRLNDEKEQETPFSLLTSFGRDEKIEENKIISDEKSEKNVNLCLENRFFVNSSDSDDEFELKNNDNNNNRNIDCFFVDPEESLVVKTVQRFRRTEDIDVIKDKWSKYRISMIKSYKRQRKEAVRRLKLINREKYRKPQGNSDKNVIKRKAD